MTTLTELQKKLDVWRKVNFPGHTWWQQLIGVSEEVGELSHHLLKQDQGIRGTYLKHELQAQDAVGDITIYLMGLCSVKGWNYEALVNKAAKEVLERNWRADPEQGKVESILDTSPVKEWEMGRGK